MFKLVLKGSGISHEPRYNIAPTQQVVTVVNNDGENQARYMRWGLIPFRAKDAKRGTTTSYAAETVTTVSGVVMERTYYMEGVGRTGCTAGNMTTC